MNIRLANKIGKTMFLFVCMILCSASLHAQLILRATSLNGNPITTVQAGEPFYLEVTTEANGRIGRPTIEGLTALTLAGQKSTTQYINGAVTTRYAYQVYSNTPGTYTVGPATVELPNGDLLSSQKITVAVTASSGNNGASSRSGVSGAQQLVVRASLDKKRAFVGEKIVCTLSCMLANKASIIANIEEPKPNGFRVANPRELRVTEIDTDGQHYYVHEWQWDLYPEKAGELTVPAFRVQAQVPYVDQRMLFSFLGQTPMQLVRTYSNACTVPVAALPATKNAEATTIGVIDSYTAHVTPAVARQGEGMTLTLAITGDCAWHMLPTPELQGIPAALKVYPSRNYDQESGSMVKKCFEYIVQALECGTWHIPAQTCTYFDTNSQTYKTVHTSPLTVTVVKDAASVPAAVASATVSVQSDTPKTVRDDSPAMHDGIYSGLYDARIDVPEMIIPWRMFMWLLCMPLLIALCWCIGTTLSRWYRRSGRTRKHTVFAHAHKRIAQAADLHDYAQLYPIFVTLFADYYAVDKATINQEMIDEWLSKAGLTEHEREQWHAFYARCMAYSFANTGTQQRDTALITAARQWLALLQEKL